MKSYLAEGSTWDILSALPHAVVVAERTGRLGYANPAVHTLLGWAPDDLIGRQVSTLIPPRLRGIHLTAFERYMRTGIPTVMGRPLEVSALRRDGTEIDVVLTLTAGQVSGAPIVIGSIEPRVAAAPDTPDRDELRFQLDFTHAIMRSLGNGVYAVNSQGRVTFANPAAERMLGWPEGDLLGRDLHETIHYRHEDGTPFPRTECPLMTVLEHGVPFQSTDDSFVRRDGSMLPVAYTSSPIITGGEIVGAVLSFQDRSAERRLEREKELFLSSVAHDLKSPLTSIKGFTQLVLRRARRGGDLPASLIVPHLERVETTVERITRLVDELLDITRVRMGHSLDLVLRPCDLLTLVRDSVEAVRPGTHRRFVIDADVDALTGQWDPGRLQRMLTNLLSNAIKYSPDRSSIRVVARREGDLAVLEVHNEGLGIPAGDLPHIFDQFHRGSNVHGEVSGAGIGLASARHIVEHHGGTIEARSQEGQGATFIVRLSMRPSAASPASRRHPG